MIFRVVVVACALSFGVCAAASGWIVRPDGIGPVKVGMTLAQANSVLHESFVEPKDEEERQCFDVIPNQHPEIGFMIQGGRVVRLDVDGPGTPTTEGIRVGDPVAKVLQVYGAGLKVELNAYDDQEKYLTVRSADRLYGIRFETDKGKIRRFYAGRLSAILLIEGCS